MTSPASYSLKLFLPDFILSNFNITGVIEDPGTFNDFSRDVKDGNWDSHSTVGAMFEDTRRAFENQGLLLVDVFARAISYIAERAGLTLLKTDATQIPFLPNGFSRVGISINTENVLKYQISDCPD